jgi:hypothetical protein
MPIRDLFSKRQKRLRGEVPDVYTYDNLPEPLRVQIIHVLRDALGDDSWSHDSNSEAAYKYIHDSLAREYGVFVLGTSRNPETDFFDFFLKATDCERELDCVEIAFQVVQEFGGDNSYVYHTHPKLSPAFATEELNSRFREHGVGYQFESGEIIRVDSQLVHSEVIKPALSLLSQKAYAGANQEYLRAHEHYRKGRFEEAITDALKSLESVLKVICTKRKWTCSQTDTAKKLLDICFTNGLVPQYLSSQFSGLRTTLESGVPTVRNKQSGHGQGVSVRTVPEHLAGYILGLTATGIVYLVRCEEALP